VQSFEDNLNDAVLFEQKLGISSSGSALRKLVYPLMFSFGGNYLKSYKKIVASM